MTGTGDRVQSEVVIKEWPNLPLMLPDSQSQQSELVSGSGEIARDALAALPTKGRAPKTGYKRSQFGDGWAKSGGCDTRNVILRRDLTNAVLGDDNCKVQAGALSDPYTGQRIAFKRGAPSMCRLRPAAARPAGRSGREPALTRRQVVGLVRSEEHTSELQSPQ